MVWSYIALASSNIFKSQTRAVNPFLRPSYQSSLLYGKRVASEPHHYLNYKRERDRDRLLPLNTFTVL